MMDEHDIDWIRLTNHLSGAESPETAVETAEWIEADAGRRKVVEQIRLGLTALPPVTVPSFDAKGTTQRVIANIRRQPRSGPSRPLFGSMRQVWGYGIAGVALAVGAFALLQWNPAGANLENTGVRQYATGRGQRLTVTLSESSHVTLAPLSRIQYSETRSGHVTVVLDGQAVFDVAHSPDRTFTVQAGRVTTRVLGTTFDVRHYATDSVVQVAVLSGKVSSAGVTSGTTSGIIAAPTIVTPGHVLLLTDSTARPALRQSVDDIVAWKDGKLIFVKTPVAEALSALGKWYEYEFRLADSTLRDAKITTTLRVDDRQESLKALQDVLNVTMTFEGNVITLHPNRGTRHVDTPVSRRRVAAINQGD